MTPDDPRLSTTTLEHAIVSMQTKTFAIADVVYRPGEVYSSHAHERASLLLVCTGGFAESTTRSTIELTSGGVVMMPAGHPHRDAIAAGGARGLLVALEPAFSRHPARWSVHHGGAVSRAMIALHRALRLGGAAEMLAYLRSARARRAASALADSPESLTDIALAAGFADQSHLCRVFRTEYGMSPRRYRQLARRSSAFKT